MMTACSCLQVIELDESCKYLQMFGLSGNDGCFLTMDNAVDGYVPKSNAPFSVTSCAIAGVSATVLTAKRYPT
jgi:hypothetical protein